MLFNPLKITFLGHACFCLEYKTRRLLTDPYSPQIGYAPIETDADFISISHQNLKYHSCLDEFDEFNGPDGAPNALYRGLEHGGQTVSRGPFGLQSIEVFEKLPDEGPNAMTVIEAGDIRVLHMGDCGHGPTDAQIEACGRVDVLLALAGEGPTLALPDLLRFIEAVGARIVIPMHYGVPGLTMQIAPVERLEELWEGAIERGGSSCLVSRADLPDAPVLRVLKPLRLRV